MSTTDDARAEDWTPAERALLDAAIEFYGAAEGAIEVSSSDRPRVRRDATRLQAVREAMATLEAHVRAAHEDGVEPERIAQIARLEREMVDLMLERREAAGG